jgi:hypothetical protein
MKQPSLPWEAGCLCGAVRFRIMAPAIMTMACHCADCQKMSASAFSTTIMLPMDAVELTHGETARGGLGTGRRRHHHCERCKSWLFTTFEPDTGFTNVRATMLDDHGWYVPFVESFTSEALPWAKTGAAFSFEKFPDEADRTKVIAAFQAAQER